MTLKLVSKTNLPSIPRAKGKLIRIFCKKEGIITDMGLQNSVIADAIAKANPKTAYIFMRPTAKINDAKAAFAIR